MDFVFNVLMFSLLVIFLALSPVRGSEEVYIQHAPSYMQFSSDIAHRHLKASQIPDVISAAMGFTTNQDLQWDGMKAGNPMKRPKGVCVAEFDGFENLDLGLNYIKYPVVVDVAPNWAFQVIADRIYKRIPDKELTLLDITNDDSMYAVKSQYPKLLQPVSVDPLKLKKDLMSDNSILTDKLLKSLNTTLSPDVEFLLDVQLFKEVVDAMRINAKLLQTEPTVDLVWFHSTALQGLIAMYGADSPQVAEAIQIIKDLLKQIENSMTKIYEGSFLMLVLAVDYQSQSTKLRLTRSLKASNDSIDHNIAETYNEDYPAIFNIIFFTCLIIGLSIFAIALGMWHMDPGRDSIIYRMTSQRIKKDQ